MSSTKMVETQIARIAKFRAPSLAAKGAMELQAQCGPVQR